MRRKALGRSSLRCNSVSSFGIFNIQTTRSLHFLFSIAYYNDDKVRFFKMFKLKKTTISLCKIKKVQKVYCFRDRLVWTKKQINLGRLTYWRNTNSTQWFCYLLISDALAHLSRETGKAALFVKVIDLVRELHLLKGNKDNFRTGRAGILSMTIISRS